MGNPVVFFEVIGQDADTLRAFYAELFGWEYGPSGDPLYGLVQAEEGGIGGGVGKADAAKGFGHSTFYVGVDDVAAYLQRAERLGGRILMPTTQVPGNLTIGLLADPEGHIIGVSAGLSGHLDE